MKTLFKKLIYKIRKVNFFIRVNPRIDPRKSASMDKGFTIVELLVVIAIVTIFTTIVISNFSQIRFQSALSRVSYTFNQDLRKAQNMALSAVPYKDSSGAAQVVDGYGVYVDLSALGNKKYIIYADKFPGNQKYDDSLDYIIETIDFNLTEPGIIIKQIDNITGNTVSVNFNFSNLNTQITQLSSVQNNVNFVFSLASDLTHTRIVSVNNAGLIETN